MNTNFYVQTKLGINTNHIDKINLDVKTNSDPQVKPNVTPGMWTLFFDGSKSNESAGVGCILEDPKGKRNLISCRLEFQCTNNTFVYEALIQGLRKVVDLKVKLIKVFGDSEIVIRQVRNTTRCISSHLKHYQIEVWYLVKNFEAFNISPIPHSLNYDAYLLANVSSKLTPSEAIMPITFFVELLYKPSVYYNITNWRVFGDDHQIISFLHMKDAFKDSTIDEDQHDQDLNCQNEVPPGQLIEAKKTQVNAIPKPMVRLEKLHDL
jgi:ribonuclease HI